MLDVVILHAITWCLNEAAEDDADETTHGNTGRRFHVTDKIFFVTYLLVCIAAIVTAAVLKKQRMSTDASPLVLATLTPTWYWILLGFRVV